MKPILISLFVVFVVCLIALDVWADMIRMKGGKLIEGKFLGGTEESIRFQTGEGTVEYPIEEILTITFLPVSFPLPKVTPLPKSTPTPQPKPQKFTIVPDTRLAVRMLDDLDTMANRKDDWFDATVDLNVIVDKVVVVPKGTLVRGQVVKSEQGKSSSALVITLRKLILKHQEIPIDTTTYVLWDKLQEPSDTNSLGTLRRSRILRISSQMFIEFKTTEPVEIDVSQ
jgi:hypothetical protein